MLQPGASSQSRRSSTSSASLSFATPPSSPRQAQGFPRVPKSTAPSAGPKGKPRSLSNSAGNTSANSSPRITASTLHSETGSLSGDLPPNSADVVIGLGFPVSGMNGQSLTRSGSEHGALNHTPGTSDRHDGFSPRSDVSGEATTEVLGALDTSSGAGLMDTPRPATQSTRAARRASRIPTPSPSASPTSPGGIIDLSASPRLSPAVRLPLVSSQSSTTASTGHSRRHQSNSASPARRSGRRGSPLASPSIQSSIEGSLLDATDGDSSSDNYSPRLNGTGFRSGKSRASGSRPSSFASGSSSPTASSHRKTSYSSSSSPGASPRSPQAWASVYTPNPIKGTRNSKLPRKVDGGAVKHRRSSQPPSPVVSNPSSSPNAPLSTRPSNPGDSASPPKSPVSIIPPISTSTQARRQSETSATQSSPSSTVSTATAGTSPIVSSSPTSHVPDTSAILGFSSSRLGRKSPGLKIDPPPPPATKHNVQPTVPHIPPTDSLRPAPPPAVPRKSPLRQLGSGAGLPQRSSRESTEAPDTTSRESSVSRDDSEETVEPTADTALLPAADIGPRPETPATSGDEGGRRTPTLVTASSAAQSPSDDIFNVGGYTPAMLTSRSAPPNTSDLSLRLETPNSSENQFPSFGNDTPPPSAPADSANNWVVSAVDKTESPHDLFGDGHDNLAAESLTTPDGGTPTTDEVSDTRQHALIVLFHDIPRWHDKALPAVPATPMRSPRTPTTPVRPGHGPASVTMRSPSMPSLTTGQTRPRGATESSPSTAFPRSSLAMAEAGLSPGPQARPQSMVLPSLPSSPIGGPSASASTSTAALSRRAHLIREIANTERAHATDLALIRDAYIGRESPLIGRESRPDSQHSTNTQHSSGNGDSAASTPALVDSRPGHARRNSSYGMPIEELRRPSIPTESKRHERRMSGQDAWPTPWNGMKSPVRKTTLLNTTGGQNGSFDTLVSPAASSSSISSAVFPSPRFPTPQSSTSLSSLNRAGRPLPTPDIKAIFLNLTQMAAVADELATEFEVALGALDDESLSYEGGSDRLGEVFCSKLPRLRPLYMHYCSRQSAASARLQQLQSDPGHAAWLNDCWSRVKAHTHAWNLDSMLIKPVQRITKYPLLFEDLLACTTPVHPDYFGIRKAAEAARALALDIDEAKRRKDVITSVIGKTSSTNAPAKESKGNGPRLLGLRRFKKDKAGNTPPGGSPSDPSGAPAEISPYHQAMLKELVARLESNDKNIRRLGREMLDFVASAKVVARNEIDINLHFLKWFTLDGKAKDPQSAKVIAYKALLEELLATAWEELNNEVSNSVMLMLGKLLDAAKNPTMIIEKLNKKATDYARYLAHRTNKRSIDRPLMQEATDYVALHTQLLEELPAFLEGYTRIIDIVVAAFTMAQGRYFSAFREKVTAFTDNFMTVPTEHVMDADGEGIKEVLVDVGTWRGIHKAWLNSFRDANLSMKSLDCTGGDGTYRPIPTAVRTASWSRKSNGGGGRPPSRSGSRLSRRSPSLRQVPESQRSSIAQSEGSSKHSSQPGLRRRSSSFTALSDAARSTGTESRTGIAGMIRRGSHNRNGSQTNLSSMADTINRSVTNLGLLPSRTRSRSRQSNHSSAPSYDDSRRSFGLPRIPMNDQPLFDDLGTPIKQPPHAAAIFYEDEYPEDMEFSALGFGDMPTQQFHFDPTRPDGVAESWRQAPTLYSCTAVADFNPLELGNHRFQGLYFLPLVAGDFVDVYHEIGRVAELYDFPYSQVGVENDGAVVCRAENGAIGVAMCSFLEPVRT